MPVSKPRPPAMSVPKKGLTAREILEKTPPRTKQAARYVVIDRVEPKVLKGNFAALKAKTHSTADPDGNPKSGRPDQYTTAVYATEPDARLHLSRVKIICSCPAHVMWGGEYALWKRGAADLKYGNGQPPVVRNPKNIPWACKHSVRLLAQIVSKKV